MQLQIPAVHTSSARALPLGVAPEGGDILVLHTAHGCAKLALGRSVRRLTPVEARWVAQPPGMARAFIDDLADRLRMRPVGEAPIALAGAVEASAVCMGQGSELSGAPWVGYKLFFEAGEQEAQVFLRLSPRRTMAQLVEKWPGYRGALLTLWERALGGAGRSWAPGRAIALRPTEELRTFAEVVHFAAPLGWRPKEVPGGGSERWVDPTDEHGFEVSELPIPDAARRLIPVGEMLRMVLSREHTEQWDGEIVPVPGLPFEGAYGRTTWRQADPKRGDTRDACGFWAVFTNGWRWAMVSFAFWRDDAAVAVPHWDRALETLDLGPRA